MADYLRIKGIHDAKLQALTMLVNDLLKLNN